MPTYLTPGVYFERPEPRPAAAPHPTDVAGFVGLAERGPLHAPRRLTTWRQFQQVFGGLLPHAHLGYAVRAFFENGGRACWVVRVADVDTARAAGLDLPDGRQPEGVAYHAHATSPGTWGERLAVSVQSSNLATSQHVVLPGLPPDRLAVASITGFEAGTRIRLAQNGVSPSPVRRVEQVDGVRGVLRFDSTLSGTDLRLDDSNHPISVESLEFTLLVWQADQVVERYANLAPDPFHSRSADMIVNQESRLIRLERGNGDGLPRLPWRGALSGGANGLSGLNIFDYLGTPQGDVYGLAQLAEQSEVSILAIPDLTLRPRPPAPLTRAPVRAVDECALDTPTARTTLSGTVVDAISGLPLAGVEVDEGTRRVETSADGRFNLADLLPGSVKLLLRLEGYEERLVRIAVSASATGLQELEAPLELTPLDLPTALDQADILYGQAAMVAQCERLRDRFALIDPPLAGDGGMLDLSQVQAWRAHFDTPFAALYYPWLRITDPLQPDDPQGRMLPPSGHVAGIYAATDAAEGVFRPPANRGLAWANDVGVPVDDAQQGVLNPKGINVIRAFPGRGVRVYGARTLSSDTAWQFVNVRRLMSMLEQAMRHGLQWSVFEPNSEQLWFGLRLSLITLLDGLWRRGAFAGDAPEQAYQVRCDATTTPPELRADGRVIAEVGVAPTVPYEFIVLRLGMTADELQVSEV